MGRKLILSCSKRKSGSAELIPALERYDGVAFRLLRRYLRISDEKPDIFILSAEYGLITSEQEIPAYDTQMTSARADRMKATVFAQAEKLFLAESLTKRNQIFINLGRNYHSSFSEVFHILETRSSLTVASGSSGKRLGQMYDWLYGEESALRQKIPQTTKTVVFFGAEISFTKEQIHECARRGLLANAHGAFAFQTWFVEIDGVRISPKWLVRELTGREVKSFHSDAARRILQQLGIEVKRI